MTTADPDKTKQLGQYLTQAWVAAALVDRYFPDLGANDLVIEPSCGTGAFLQAIPSHVPALGVEIDPELAAIAQRASGRRVIVGDFRLVDLPVQPTAFIGNPPFSMAFIDALLNRAHLMLPEGARCGLILPCSILQTSGTVTQMAERWSIDQTMIPRNIFPGLSMPLCFAQFTKGATRGLVNFALYHEHVAVMRLQARYRELLERGEGSVWVAVVRAALESLGGTASLTELYREIEGHRPTTNEFWKPQVRKIVQMIARRVGEGVWQLPDAAPLAA